jgi:putative hydroxymethylpyrimidine transport system permease protein
MEYWRIQVSRLIATSFRQLRCNGSPRDRWSRMTTRTVILPLIVRPAESLAVVAAFLILWQLAISLFAPAPFLLPPPHQVLGALIENHAYLASNALITLHEMVAGLLIGSAAGVLFALLMANWRAAERLLMPMIVTTQTLPVFAVAPLLVIWFGYGLGSKIVMASLIIFFPVASAFFDGLRSVNQTWLDLSDVWGASRTQVLLKIKLPAALPSLASGLKLAATVAPIGAVVGEWAGASAGLGYVMLQANARMQTDLVFAVLLVLATTAFLLRAIVAALVDRAVFWQGKA